MLAEDLAGKDLRDVLNGLDDLGKARRPEGETAFPALPTLLQAILERRVVREAQEAREIESRAWEEHKAQCERERLEDIGRELTPMERKLNELLQAAARAKTRVAGASDGR